MPPPPAPTPRASALREQSNERSIQMPASALETVLPGPQPPSGLRAQGDRGIRRFMEYREYMCEYALIYAWVTPPRGVQRREPGQTDVWNTLASASRRPLPHGTDRARFAP